MTITNPSRAQARAGLVLTALVSLFLVFDGVTHLLKVQPVVDSFDDLGYPVHLARGLGLLELVLVALYLLPRTAPLGAVLLTGYLGGAVSAQVRVEAPLFSTRLFAVYVGVLVWLALWLRDARVRALVLSSPELSAPSAAPGRPTSAPR